MATTIPCNSNLCKAIATTSFLPLIWIYCRIVSLFPGLDFYSIIQNLFGKIAGSILIMLMFWYAIHVSALILQSFVEYTVVIALEETPRIPLMMAILSISAYLAKSGIKVLGRCALIICVTVLVNLVFTIVLSLGWLHFSNILPMLNHSIQHIASDSCIFGALAFGETVIALVILGALRKGDSPYKAYFPGLLIGAFALTLVVLRNLLILGPDMMLAATFHSYTAVRIISLSSFLERVESLISLNLVLMGITKIALCLSAASIGVAKLIGEPEYKQLIIPISILTLVLCSFLFESIMEMFSFVQAYRFYAIPFQILIPILIWIAAEIKMRKHKEIALGK